MKKRIIKIPLFNNDKNKHKGLTYVIEDKLPFKIKRVFLKYKFKNIGNHTNKITNMGILCISGSVEVLIKKEKIKKKYILDNPSKLLLIYKNEWRRIKSFKKNTVAIFFASEKYLKNEYIYD